MLNWIWIWICIQKERNQVKIKHLYTHIVITLYNKEKNEHRTEQNKEDEEKRIWKEQTSDLNIDRRTSCYTNTYTNGKKAALFFSFAFALIRRSHSYKALRRTLLFLRFVGEKKKQRNKYKKKNYWNEWTNIDMKAQRRKWLPWDKSTFRLHLLLFFKLIKK